MKWLIHKCTNCKVYTLSDKCLKCGKETVSAHPHRYSPTNKYVKYRVLMKYSS